MDLQERVRGGIERDEVRGVDLLLVYYTDDGGVRGHPLKDRR